MTFFSFSTSLPSHGNRPSPIKKFLSIAYSAWKKQSCPPDKRSSSEWTPMTTMKPRISPDWTDFSVRLGNFEHKEGFFVRRINVTVDLPQSALESIYWAFEGTF
jgi:hypothetical protein